VKHGQSLNSDLPKRSIPVSEETLDYKTYKQIKQMMLNFDIVPGQRIVIT